jgi:carboxymethylenebutenolidase
MVTLPEMTRSELSRREMIAGSVGAGFALAVRPVSAATITTSAEGLDVADVRIPAPAGDVAAYLARPARPAKPKGKPPIVLVVHEIFGVHEHIRDVCRRLAKLGALAIAPDLFSRQGDVSKIADFKEIMAKVVSKVPDAQVIGDLDATLAWAKAAGGGDGKRVGITGFCWGGRIVWLYAAHTADSAGSIGIGLKAGVAWYGRLVGDKDAAHPSHPIDVAATLKAPVMGLYGGQDQGIPAASVDQMRKALAAGSPAAKRSEIHVYPDAGHAFFADYRPSYRAAEAADGWTRLQAWFKANGVL